MSVTNSVSAVSTNTSASRARQSRKGAITTAGDTGHLVTTHEKRTHSVPSVALVANRSGRLIICDGVQ